MLLPKDPNLCFALGVMKTPLSKSIRSGFSLVELLVVIAVIAVIAAIAIPSIAGITSAARYSKDKRNAQNLASTSAAARAAGLTDSWANVGIGIAAMTNGVSVTNGGVPFSFRVDGLNPTEITGAERHLGTLPPLLGTLVYTPIENPTY